jgi:hypothetical protein
LSLCLIGEQGVTLTTVRTAVTWSPLIFQYAEMMTSEERVHFKILSAVGDDSYVSRRELARQVVASNGKMHCLMSALEEEDLRKMQPFALTDGKLGRVSCLFKKREGVKNQVVLTRDYLASEGAMYEALLAEIKALPHESVICLSDLVGASEQKNVSSCINRYRVRAYFCFLLTSSRCVP